MRDDPDGLLTDAVQDAAKRITQRFQMRLAREMAGASMAGYDALTVVRSPATPSQKPPDAELDPSVSIQMAFIPTYTTSAPILDDWPDGVHVDRYDVRDLTRQDIDQLRTVWTGDAWGDSDD